MVCWNQTRAAPHLCYQAFSKYSALPLPLCQIVASVLVSVAMLQASWPVVACFPVPNPVSCLLQFHLVFLGPLSPALSDKKKQKTTQFKLL